MADNGNDKLQTKASIRRAIRNYAQRNQVEVDLIVQGMFAMARDSPKDASRLNAARFITECIDGLLDKNVNHTLRADKTIIKGLRAAQAPALPGEEVLASPAMRPGEVSELAEYEVLFPEVAGAPKELVAPEGDAQEDSSHPEEKGEQAESITLDS